MNWLITFYLGDSIKFARVPNARDRDDAIAKAKAAHALQDEEIKVVKSVILARAALAGAGE